MYVDLHRKVCSHPDTTCHRCLDPRIDEVTHIRICERMSSSIQTVDRQPGPSALVSVVVAGLMTSMVLQEDRDPSLDPIESSSHRKE